MLGKIFTVLGLVSMTTFAQQLDFSDELSQLKQFGGNVIRIGADADRALAQNERTYQAELARIVNETLHQIENNYAQVVQPVAQEYSEFLKTLEVNVACNETCVA